MQRLTTFALGLVLAPALGCSSPSSVPAPAPPEFAGKASEPGPHSAAEALQRGEFARAQKAAYQTLAEWPGRSREAAIAALARYVTAGQELISGSERELRAWDHEALRARVLRFSTELATIDGLLATAARDPQFSLELCIACWEVDWNHSGRFDDRDRRLLAIEHDRAGRELAKGDPRRRPTFRFDLGDVHWARAMLSFQRAATELVLAYDWSGLRAQVEREGMSSSSAELRFPLAEPQRVRHARELIIAGLRHSRAARRAYLEERDDDREWVPSPRQKDHPVPLAMDSSIYATWAGVLDDMEKLVTGAEQIRVADVFELAEIRGVGVPSGYLDVGAMLSQPKDLVLRVGEALRADRRRDTDATLRAIFGTYYVSKGRASNLPKRLVRMKAELDRGEDELGRKLRYLVWIN